MRLGRNAGVICAVLVFSLTGVVRAQEASLEGARFAVAVGAETPDAETARRIVASSVELYLRTRRVVVVPFDERPVSVELSGELGRAARRVGADYVILGMAGLDAQEVEVDLRLYAVDGRELLGQARRSQRAGLQVDRAIADLTESVLEQARPRLVEELSTTGEDREEAEERTAADARDRPVPEPLAEPPRDRFVWLDARFAPFIPVEPAADYIGITYRSGSATILAFPFSGDLLGLGLSARLLRADAAGVVTSAALRLVPFGLSVQAGPGVADFAPYVRLTGGASRLEATNDVLGGFTSFVPYVAAELGVQAELFGPVAVHVFVGFDALFERSLLILGFSPGIGLAVGI